MGCLRLGTRRAPGTSGTLRLECRMQEFPGSIPSRCNLTRVLFYRVAFQNTPSPSPRASPQIQIEIHMYLSEVHSKRWLFAHSRHKTDLEIRLLAQSQIFEWQDRRILLRRNKILLSGGMGVDGGATSTIPFLFNAGRHT